MKKSWVVTAVILSTLLLTYIVFQVSRVRTYDNHNSLKVIPSGAAVIIKAENINYLRKSLLDNADFASELMQSDILKPGLIRLVSIDSLSMDKSSVIYEVNNLPFYCSLHSQGKESVKAFYLVELPNRSKELELIQYIRQIDKSGYEVNERSYNAKTIYEITEPRLKHMLYVFIDKGVALASSSHLLIESSIRQLHSEDNWNDSDDFKQIRKTVGAGSKLNVFVNFSNIKGVLKPFVGPSFKSGPEKLSAQSAWAELDVDIHDDALLFNGFITGNSKGVFSHLITNSDPQKSEIQGVLPGNTRAYISLSLENGEVFKQRIRNYYKENSGDAIYQKTLNSIKERYELDFEHELFRLLQGKLALAYSDYNYLQPEANGVLVVKLNSKSKGKEMTLEMLKKLHERDLQSLKVKTYKPDDGVRYSIYKGFPEKLMEHIFSAFLPKVPQKFLAFYDDNLIMADSPTLIEQFIYSNLLSKTLKYNRKHQVFLSNFSSRENLFAFCEASQFSSLLGNSLEPLFGVLKQGQKEALNNFYGIGMQLSGTGQMIYSTLYLQYMPERESEPRTIWQSLLDSTVFTKPVLVKNHYTNEREVIVQDEAYNIYLLGNNGRMLWKKPLDGPVVSDIIQIDYYRNNKLQYLFNTTNKIYLLDRNGNHVANFPVKLPSKATNGMAVFDYDNNRNYRFFVACENRKIYLYNEKGNIITGWKFGRTDGEVNLPVQHLRSNGKDYIVFADDKRNYICDRKGNIRLKLKKDFIRNVNSPYYLENTNTSEDCLVTTTNNGEVAKIYLADGRVSVKEFTDISSPHAMSVFKKQGNNYYLFSELNKVSCFNKQADLVFEREFDNKINLDIDHYHFSSQNIKFGVTEADNGNIYLLNGNGKVYKGFPLKGMSRFSIGFLKSSSTRFNLIVGGANNYIYNYQVD